MSNRRYIELYSANRNRNQYPLQSSFEVPFAPTRQLSSGYQAFDALCTGPIFYKWNGYNNYNVGTNPNFPWPIASPATAGNSTPGCIYIPAASTDLSPMPNYYVGYQLNNLAPAPNNEKRLIVGYDPSNAKFILDQPFTAVPTNVGINDPSDGTTSTYGVAKIHIPTKDINDNCVRVWSNAYDGCYIVDETASDESNIIYAMITSYNFLTQIATLDRPLTGWTNSDQLTIRKTLPQEKYTLTALPTSNGTFVYYNGIIYNSSVLSSTVGTIVVPGVIVTLPANQGNREINYYAGKYIYNTSNSASPPINGGGIYGLYFIKSSYYNHITGLVELLVDHTSIPQITCSYNQQSQFIQNPNPDNFLQVGNIINIVNYIKDNYAPLNYNGSVVSQSESVCYEVSLISLILPNVVLRTGARAAFYPFFYVEFTNTTSPSGASNNIIYSNSPTSNRALFIVPVTDTQQPLNSSFVKLYSNMSQTIKFKPNDSLRFSVYLPDGRLFETVEQDYLSPYPPNGILQIDAVFGIRRI